MLTVPSCMPLLPPARTGPAKSPLRFDPGAHGALSATLYQMPHTQACGSLGAGSVFRGEGQDDGKS